MNLLKSLASGLAGAAALTIAHQLLKDNVDDAPRMDKLGKQALKHSLTKAGITLPSRVNLRRYTFAGDIIANTLYYSLVGLAPKASVTTGIALGVSAGVGAVALPEPLGLNPAFAGKSDKTKLLTIGLYTLGGIVAGAVACVLKDKE
ncbi:hypothetical protein [Deminuibacter soli]|uniref:DUF1440 domain-containing protein n=1 Tax=Deminuibacter soli TaxID=2291815 RepID=A0A3E1NFU3_9BACT|nr:hypothetical protein [Deminuibacter soli]RFM26846.1 hypothetical protein DXN05_17815 [Deminuibacter soli]